MGAGPFTGIPGSPPFCGGRTPSSSHPGLIACGRVEFIKNNCLAGVISISWQSLIILRPRLPVLSLLLGIRNLPVPGDTSSHGEVRPEIRALQIMRGKGLHSALSTLQERVQNPQHNSLGLMQLLPIFLVERVKLREARPLADKWLTSST